MPHPPVSSLVTTALNKQTMTERFNTFQIPSTKKQCFSYDIQRWYPAANLTAVRSATIMELFAPGKPSKYYRRYFFLFNAIYNLFDFGVALNPFVVDLRDSVHFGSTYTTDEQVDINKLNFS